jgi:hypothetical protein
MSKLNRKSNWRAKTNNSTFDNAMEASYVIMINVISHLLLSAAIIPIS